MHNSFFFNYFFLTSICQLSHTECHACGKMCAVLPAAAAGPQWLWAVFLGLLSDEVMGQAGQGNAPGQNRASSWPISVHVMANQNVQSCHSAWPDNQTPGGQSELHKATLLWLHWPAVPTAGFIHPLPIYYAFHLNSLEVLEITQSGFLFFLYLP